MSGIPNRAVNARISDGHGRSWANAATVGETPEVIFFSFDCGAPGVVAGVPVELRPSTVRGISDNRQINLSQYGNFLPIRHSDRISFINPQINNLTSAPVLQSDLYQFQANGTVNASLVSQVSTPANVAAAGSAPNPTATFTLGNLVVGGLAVPPTSEPIPATGGGWVLPVVVTPSAGDITSGFVYVVEVRAISNNAVGVNL